MLRAYLQLIRFDKPIGSLLLLWPTWWGLWLAFAGVPPLKVLFAFSLGVFLTRSAGCAINDYADSEFDGQVARTAARPLARGIISKKSALLVCVAFSLLAFLVAYVCLKPQTLLWSLPALFLFISYPFFKRFFPVPQLYLGMAFSFGIPMAFIESSGSLPLAAYLLFAANCCWVLAYDTIYALVDIEDDIKLRLKTSAITFGGWVLVVILLCYVFFIALLLAIGLLCHLCWPFYLALGVVVYLIWQLALKIRGAEPQKCFQAFLFNNNLGAVLWLGIFFSYLVN